MKRKIIIVNISNVLIGNETLEELFDAIIQKADSYGNNIDWTTVYYTNDPFREIDNSFCAYVKDKTIDLSSIVQQTWENLNKLCKEAQKGIITSIPYHTENMLNDDRNLIIFCTAKEARKLKALLDTPSIMGKGTSKKRIRQHIGLLNFFNFPTNSTNFFLKYLSNILRIGTTRVFF